MVFFIDAILAYKLSLIKWNCFFNNILLQKKYLSFYEFHLVNMETIFF